MSPSQKLSQIMNDIIQLYLSKNCPTTWDINNGLCDSFANEVIDKFLEEYPDSKIQEVWFEEHCLILFDGRYYDAECLKGVTNWRNIPLFLNRKKTREQVLRERKSY